MDGKRKGVASAELSDHTSSFSTEDKGKPPATATPHPEPDASEIDLTFENEKWSPCGER